MLLSTAGAALAGVPVPNSMLGPKLGRVGKKKYEGGEGHFSHGAALTA